MDTNFLNEIKPIVIERLGRFYNRDFEYKQALKNEAELFNELEKSLSESQFQAVKDYQNAICSTWGICEMISYRQGMRDMAALLGTENKRD